MGLPISLDKGFRPFRASQQTAQHSGLASQRFFFKKDCDGYLKLTSG